jgi:pilus assembly protein CpaC
VPAEPATSPNAPPATAEMIAPLQQVQAEPGKVKGEELPPPRASEPFGPGQFRLPLMGQPPVHVNGNAPPPTPGALAKYKNFVQEMVDPELTLDLVSGRTRLMVLKRAPRRIQVADDSVVAYNILSPTEITLLGRSIGVTVLTFWFEDPADATKVTTLTYHVRVVPDPDMKARLERAYAALSEEINHVFPNSNVCLRLVGDKLAVTGNARDVGEATMILRIVRANAPMPYSFLGGFSPFFRQHVRPPDMARVPVDRMKPAAEPGPNENPVPPGESNYEQTGSSQIINLLRIQGEQQVMLRVTVAEVNRAAARSIGLNFNIRNHSGQGVFAQSTGSIATGGSTFNNAFGLSGFGALGSNSPFLNGVPGLPGFAVGAGGFNNLPAALDNGQIRLAISALRDLNYARSLAEPNLTTINGQTATFQAGGQFPVPVVSGFGGFGLQGVNFVPYGVLLNFTPFITDRDRIRLDVAASVSSRDLAAGVTNVAGSSVPSLISRNFQTTVELREGQTLAVAGLIQNNLGANANRVPFFGDLPILGRLAGFDRISAGEQELVVLITPQLVHPLDPKEVPPLPGSDIFEPNDCEFYLLGRLESHRPYDYRSPIRTDWQRMCDYYRLEKTYISGPHGHGE